MKNSTMNMTEGGITGLLIRFSIPMLMGNLFQQLYNIVDSIIVGKLVGADALAAVGVTGPMGFFFFALCNGIGAGGGIVTSQSFGSGDTKNVKSCITNVGYIMIAFPFVVGIAAFFLSGPLLRLLDTFVLPVLGSFSSLFTITFLPCSALLEIQKLLCTF